MRAAPEVEKRPVPAQTAVDLHSQLSARQAVVVAVERPLLVSTMRLQAVLAVAAFIHRLSHLSVRTESQDRATTGAGTAGSGPRHSLRLAAAALVPSGETELRTTSLETVELGLRQALQGQAFSMLAVVAVAFTVRLERRGLVVLAAAGMVPSMQMGETQRTASAVAVAVPVGAVSTVVAATAATASSS